LKLSLIFARFEIPSLEVFQENMATPLMESGGLIHHDHSTNLLTLDNEEDLRKRRKYFPPKNLSLIGSYSGFNPDKNLNI